MIGGAGRYLGAALLAWLPACAGEQPSPPAPLTAAVAPAGFPSGPIGAAAPPENALTEARAQLGKRLFFDPRLSRTGSVSCGTCHLPEYAFAQPTAVSMGVDGRRGVRNAPSLANAAWSSTLFWDGRVGSLEEQAGKPLENPDEMDLPLDEAVRRIADDEVYRRMVADAYGGPPSELNLRQALASFVRTIVSGDSAYDRHLRGDEGALEPSARRGLALFFDKAGCFRCHPSGTLTNDGFFNDGSYQEGGDPGRRAITSRTGDLGKFKVPGLRNVAVTAPYMHDGSLATLEAVVDQYARGGRGGPNMDALIAPLELSADEKADLIAFLRALTDETFLRDPRYRP
jgi:cytochrome c peroxidase